MQRKIVLASNNRGKLKEIQDIVSSLDIEFIPQNELNVPDVEETGLSFVENAIIKARHASKITGLPAIADDSGLEVDALNGEPGVFSARYAGPQCDDQKNIEKLLAKLDGVPASERTARFHAATAFIRFERDPSPVIFHKTWEGRILFEPQGDQGFGYDPIFYVPEYQCSSAELDPDVKNKISHRGQALEELVKYLSSHR